MPNVAFNCVYNDGGPLGFGGTCSIGNILRNVRFKRPWCSELGSDDRASSPCRLFYKEDDQITVPSDPLCHESRIFKEWGFCTRVRRMTRDVEGKIALLTTRHPKRDTEHERIIFGVYKIAVENRKDGVWLTGKSENFIRLPETTAFALPFWKFKQYENGRPIWGHSIFRYIMNQEIANFLHALHPMMQSPEDKMTLERLLKCCGNLKPEDVDGDLYKKVDYERKYGSGGEGKQHLHLKEYVAQHPEVLGLGGGRVSVEHRFITGDRVDLSIEFADGQHCVVEIEVEGRDSTLIGAHQAIKYRALRAAQLDMVKPRPCAFLVAYSIPQSTKQFCRRHGVKALEISRDTVEA